MINVIIESDNFFLREGVKHCLIQASHEKLKEDITILKDFNSESIASSDVLVLLLSPGDESICMEALKHKRNGLVIFFSGDTKKQTNPSAACHARSLHFSLTDSVTHIISEISNALTGELKSLFYPPPNCKDCRVRRLTQQQYIILDLLMSGISTEQISINLDISIKAIHYHKYNIMKQYGLRNDYELFIFHKKRCRKNLI